MVRFDLWMVGLDFSATDQSVISYVAHLADYLHPQNIHFIHVKESFEVPGEMTKYLPNRQIPTLESI